MSAISGFIRFDQGAIDRESVLRVLRTMAIYGPDRQGTAITKSSAFAWNGFMATPEDWLDSQPIVDRESGFTVLFDGRVDNRSEIASRLALSVFDEKQLSDAALVMRLVKNSGKRAPEILRGDFALACWDSVERELWLARDPAGLRPLFYFRGHGFAAFCSMPKGLFCFPGVIKRLNVQYLEDYVLLLPADSDLSLFKGVHRIQPGTGVTIKSTGVQVWRYHDFRAVREVRLSSDEEYIEAFGELLDNAVQRRLRSDGKIASYLSSGLDSTTVAVRAAALLLEKQQRLSCYTAVPAEGFELETEGPFYIDEGPGARAVAAMYPNIEHHLVKTGHISPLRDLDEMIDLLDRPPLNMSNSVWVNEIQRRAAHEGCRVLLQGTMGNATISYTGLPHLPALLKSFRWLSLAQHFRPSLKAALRGRSRTLRFLLLSTFGPFMPRWLWRVLVSLDGRGFLNDPAAYTALNVRNRNPRKLEERAKELGFDLSYRPWSDGRALRALMLSRMDRGEYWMLACARGVDERDPTADQDLVEFCLGVPEHLYVRKGQFRWLLKQAMRSKLPTEVLKPRGKGLQAADWFVGASGDLDNFRSRLKEFSGNQKATDLLDVEVMEGLIDNWPDAGWGKWSIDQAYGSKLLRGVTIGAFVGFHDPTNRLQNKNIKESPNVQPRAEND